MARLSVNATGAATLVLTLDTGAVVSCAPRSTLSAVNSRVSHQPARKRSDCRAMGTLLFFMLTSQLASRIVNVTHTAEIRPAASSPPDSPASTRKAGRLSTTR